MFGHKSNPLAFERILWVLLTALCLELTFGTGVSTLAHAATTIRVDSLDGGVSTDGNCSLHEAISAANTDSAIDTCAAGSGADIINFNITGTIQLSLELPSILQDLTILSPSREQLTISGNNAWRVFHVGNGVTVTLSGLVIRGGNTVGTYGAGAGILNEGTLMVNNSTLSDNSASSGGGISNRGNLIVNNSTLSNNTASSAGGGIFNSGMITVNHSTLSGNYGTEGGAISTGYGNGKLEINNSTLSMNSATRGAGIYDYFGVIAINNSTIFANLADAGGAIYRFFPMNSVSGNDATGNVTIRNTIVDGSCYFIWDLMDGGHNLDSGNSCRFSTTNGSLINTNPKLAPLADNGGPTETHALQPDSPAIDGGDDGVCADQTTVNQRDQRGVIRSEGTHCDIGAYELELPKEIVAVPATIQFPTRVEGGSNPIPIALSINNALATGPYFWSVQTDATWLLASPAYGNTPTSIQIQADISTLPPGLHTANVLIDSVNPTVSNSPYTVPVTIQVAPKNGNFPILSISQANLRFQTNMLAGNPAPSGFGIENLGGGMLNWQATVNNEANGWLTLDRTSGVVPATVNTQVNISGLTPGTYVGEITVNEINSTSPPHVIRVILTLKAGPTLSLNTSKLIFEGRKNQENLLPQVLLINNSGDGSLNWQATENIEWLTLDINNSATPATVRATVNTSGLNVGVYRGVVTVNGTNAANSPAQVDIVLNILAAGSLDVTPTLLTFDSLLGSNPSAAQITVRNSGLGTLEWVASEDIPWLSLSKTSGLIPDTNGYTTLQVEVNNALLPSGAHQGQLTFTSSSGDASPQTVNVLQSIASPAKYCSAVDGRIRLHESSRVILSVENANITHTTEGCKISGSLRMRIPQNDNLTVNLVGDVRLENNQAIFRGEFSNEIALSVANLNLKLSPKNVLISENAGLQMETVGWELPEIFGGGFQPMIANITIGKSNILISGQESFDLPDLKLGGFSVTQNKAILTFANDASFQVEMSGTMHISLPYINVTRTIKQNFGREGIRINALQGFTIPGFAGFDLIVTSAQVDSLGILAKSASLKAPKIWGGVAVTIYDLRIESNGKVKIGGGGFELPDIKVGGGAFSLTSLRGKLISIPNGGYEIQARGMFGMSGFSSGRACKLLVDITVQTDSNQTSILTIKSADDAQILLGTDSAQSMPEGIQDPTAIEGLRLRQFTLGVHCRPGWPIATTGFSLTGVQGSIQLGPTIEQVSLKVWIESNVRIGSTPVVSAVPELSIRPKPFALDFNAPIDVFGFEAYRTKVHIDKKRFAAEFSFRYQVVRAGFGMETGRGKSGTFYLRGNGWAEVFIKKGEVIHECFTYPSPTWNNPLRTRKSCLNVPDSGQYLLGAGAAIDLKGIDANVRITKFEVSAHYDFKSRDWSYGVGFLSDMVTSVQIEEVRHAVNARMRGDIVNTALAERISFAPDGTVLVTMPVAQAMPLLQAADVITSYPIALKQDVIFGLVQPPTGTLQLFLIDPTGREFSANTLPDTIHYQQSVNVSETQTIYTIAGAETGNWLAKVVGDTSQPFALVYAANTPKPVLRDLTIVTTANPDQIRVDWRLLAVEPETRISFYAQGTPLTTTFIYTDVNENLVMQTMPIFLGDLLAENHAPDLTGNIQSQLLDLSLLPTGQYRFWLEASGSRGGFTRCFIRLDSTTCDESGINGVTVTVDHLASLPLQWATTITTEIDSKQSEMLVQFVPNPHPDIDNYIVRLKTTDLLTPTEEIVNEYEIGPVDNSGSSIIVSNIAPGHTYSVAIGAQDLDSGRLAWSQEQSLTTPQPQFLISTPVTNTQLIAGGIAVTVPIILDMASDLPYPIAVALDYERLPDGIYVNFDKEIIEPTSTQEQSIASISVSDTLLPGNYIVPILAQSGQLEHNLNMTISVKMARTETNIFLLIVIR